tara:strand:+ start:1184 stop:3070 length:1887 start_codon:yes stop_codon:yes gene_type:complete
MVDNVKTEIRTVEFNDGTKYDLEVDIDTPDSQVQAAAEEQYANDNAPEINNITEGARQVAKGLTLGWNEEIEAKIRAGGPGIIQLPDELKALAKENQTMFNRKFTGKLNEQELARYNKNATQVKSYQDAIKKGYNDKYIAQRNQLRAQGNEFSRQNPKTALGLEMLGGIAIPGGLARTGGKQLLSRLPGALKTPGAQMVGYGTGYGAGTAEETSDMLGSAAISGLTSLVGGKAISGLGGVIAPQFSKLQTGARDFMANRGINLTPGQAKGGLINYFEQRAGSVIPGIKERRAEGVIGWNNTIANKVLSPLGKKINKDVTELPDMSKAIDDEIDKAYFEVAKNLVVKKSANLNNKLKDILIEAKERGLNPKGLKKLKNEINWLKGQINRGKKTDGLTGEPVKLILKDAKSRERGYRTTTDADDSLVHPYMEKVLKSLDDELGIQNPIYKPKLDLVNSAYSDVVKFNRVVKNKGDSTNFTPKQLRSANTSGEMSTAAKIKEGAQQNKLLGREANEADKILTNTLPDSGTAGNTITNLTGLGLAGLGIVNQTDKEGDYSTANSFAKAGLGAATITWALYTKTGQAAIRNYLLSGGAKNKLADFLRANAPVGGLLAEQTSDRTGLDSLLGIR